jgi:hypothetical protein
MLGAIAPNGLLQTTWEKEILGWIVRAKNTSSSKRSRIGQILIKITQNDKKTKRFCNGCY